MIVKQKTRLTANAIANLLENHDDDLRRICHWRGLRDSNAVDDLLGQLAFNLIKNAVGKPVDNLLAYAKQSLWNLVTNYFRSISRDPLRKAQPLIVDVPGSTNSYSTDRRDALLYAIELFRIQSPRAAVIIESLLEHECDAVKYLDQLMDQFGWSRGTARTTVLRTRKRFGIFLREHCPDLLEEFNQER